MRDRHSFNNKFAFQCLRIWLFIQNSFDVRVFFFFGGGGGGGLNIICPNETC